MAFENEPTIDAVGGRAETPGSGDLIGRRLGPYRVLELLGEGGFGAVYLAEQGAPVRRHVAIKVLRPGMDSRAVLARFEAERQALALMDHPGIARVYDAGMTPEGRPFFAMELVRGEPIDRYCSRHRLDVDSRVRLVVQVAEAVHHGHMKGVIHRDLKPANVLVEEVDRRPVARIIDFGVAKALHRPLTEQTIHTERGQMIGTPEYMAPEQARGDVLDVDTRADVYSLGAILYELLTGATPIESHRLRGAGFAEIPAILEQVDPVRPSERVSRDASEHREGSQRVTLSRRLRGELDWIVMRCLEKDRGMRYDSASALAADLDRYLRDEPVEAGPPSVSYRLQKFVRRHRAIVTGLVAVGAVLVLGMAGTGAGMAWALRESERSRNAEILAEQRASQATDARREAEAVTRFLTSAIESVQPGEGRRDITMVEVLDHASGRLGVSFAGTPLVEAGVRHALGSAYAALGELAAADRHLPIAYEIRRARLGEQHPETLRVLGNVASLRHAQGRFAEAETLWRTASAGYSSAGLQDTRDGLGVLNNLAQTYWRLGRLDEAIGLQREALAAQRRVLGDSHANTLGSIANLAAMLGAAGDDASAEVLLLETLDAWRRLSGEEHPDTLLAMHMLGVVYQRTGRLEEAERLQRRVMQVRERVLGPSHPQTLGAMINLALTVRAMGGQAEAEELYVRAVDLSRAALGDGHPVTLSGAQNLLGLYESQGWPARAAERILKLAGLMVRVSELADVDAEHLNSAAWFLLSAEPESARDAEGARRLAVRACEMERRAEGSTLWMYLDTLALAHYRCGDARTAAEVQREALGSMPPEGEVYREEMTSRLKEFEVAAGG